jgi:general nucleoside transport system permease protein
MNGAFTVLLEGTIRTATPLAFAALGETVVERSGVINIGLEGSIIAGALGGLIAAGHGGVWLGFMGAMIAGASVALLFALFAVVLRADQIITGTAITLLALGATGTVYRIAYGSSGAALTTPTMTPLRIPGLANIPLLGPACFVQPSITYLAYLLVPAIWWWMYRTQAGLALRAIGEHPAAAIAAGISPQKVQSIAVVFGGALGGISGGMLVLAQAGTFAQGMSAGRGFIAIAIVVLGRWNPLGTALAALIFGGASALQFFFQAMGWTIPYQLFLAFPYVLTLIALASTRGQTLAPAALGRKQLQPSQ